MVLSPKAMNSDGFIGAAKSLRGADDFLSPYEAWAKPGPDVFAGLRE